MVQQPLPCSKHNVKLGIMKKTLVFTILTIALLTGCGKRPAETVAVTPYEPEGYIAESELTEAGKDPQAAASELEPINNYDTKLSVPTCITQIDGTWFIVDCYHNRLIYSDTLGVPLTDWRIMTTEVTQPHTIASDGTVYMIDDTENNKVRIFEKVHGVFLQTQVFYDIGNRPHYTVYDKATDTFYVWSSITGELYCFRRDSSSTRVYLTDIRKVDDLEGIYVRSFSIIDGDIYFVSGISDSDSEATSKIYRCDLSDLSVKEKIDVPSELAGMAQITKIQDYYYITVSTDASGSQDSATLVRTKSLHDLMQGEYEDIYSEYFVGGGTPYYISEVDDTYFLTEHRLADHGIWSFKIKNNEITKVTPLY